MQTTSTSEQPGSIHLVTCVGVDTESAHLPHFIEHYRSLGIAPENFHIILNTADENSSNLQRAKALLHTHGIRAPHVWIAPYTSDSMWAKRREIQANVVPPAHWVVSADVDEFHEYPRMLAAFLTACDARGVNCIQGVFIDRLAADGRLVPVEEHTSIWKRFPIEADVQCSIGQTGLHHDWYGTVKIMALKGALLPSRGGHHPETGAVPIKYLFGRHLARFPDIGNARFRFYVPLRVHHFKWTASMPKTLRRRLATPGVSLAGAEYGQKLLDYFANNDGVNLADVPIRQSDASERVSWRRRLVYLRALSLTQDYTHKLRRLKRRVERKFVSS